MQNDQSQAFIKSKPVEEIYDIIDDNMILGLLKELNQQKEWTQGWSNCLHQLLLQYPEELQALIKVIAFSQDTPSWQMLGSFSESTNMLVLGGEFGRQPENLAPDINQIVVLENCPIKQQFLTLRYAGIAKNISIMSYRDFLLDSKSIYKFNLIHIRSHLLNIVSTEELRHLLQHIVSRLADSGELFIETAEELPFFLHLFQSRLPLGWASTGDLRYDKSWWLSYIDELKHFQEPNIFYLNGPHWWSKAYLSKEKAYTFCCELISNRRSGFYQKSLLLLIRLLFALGYVPLTGVLITTRHKSGAFSDNKQLSLSYNHKICGKRELALDRAILSGYRISGNGIVSLRLEPGQNGWDEDAVYIRMSVNQVGNRRLLNAHEAISDIKSKVSSDISKLIPNSQQESTVRFGSIYSEAIIAGGSLSKYNESSAEQILAWLAGLHKQTLSIVNSSQDLVWLSFGQKRIDQIIATVEQVLEWYGSKRHYQDWTIIKPALLSPPFREGLALCRTHGDLNLGNLLFDLRKNELTGVIDWETSYNHWFPGRDVYDMLVNFYHSNYRMMPETYRDFILHTKPVTHLSKYLALVPSEIRYSVTHSWSKIVFPLDRLQTVFDGYELIGVVTKDGWGDDLLRVLGYIAEYQRTLVD